MAYRPDPNLFNNAFGGGLRSGSALADLLRQRQKESVLQDIANQAAAPNANMGAIGADLIRIGETGAGLSAIQEPSRLALAQAKLNQAPTSVREYLYGQQDPAFNQWKINQRRAGATNVSVGLGPKFESAFDKKLGGIQADRYGEFQTNAATAQNNLSTLNAMEQMVSQPGFYSGAGAQQVQALKRVGRALGFDADGIDSMESFNALSKQAALEAMGGSLGTGFSNADRDFVEDQVPNLGNTPEGNIALIEINKRIANRKIEIGKLAREYVQANGRLDYGFDQVLGQWAQTQPPLFEGIKATPPQAPGVTGDADIDALLKKYSD